ncbi:MAG TPA: hypothetical protein VFX60_14105, partial [Micromonospora sp.]|nr:hypothetical protein [Micromonospora sp.]
SAKINYRLAGDDVGRLYALLRDVAGARSAETAAAREAYLGADDTQAINRDELLHRLQAGKLIAVDVRPGEEYAAGPSVWLTGCSNGAWPTCRSRR